MLFWRGVRIGSPFGLACVLIGASFGAVAETAGLSPAATIVMSAIVCSIGAQFSTVAILASGGTVGAAIGATALMNSRFLPMGVAIGPSLRGRRLWRAVQGQALLDTSWALAARGDGTYDRRLMFGATAVQYVTFVGGTALGAFGGDVLGDPAALGLDAVYPAFFVFLILKEARDGRSRGVAALGALIALALIPIAPAGVPVLVASAAALVGLRRRVERPAPETVA
jgi:predicted branched-subunit amino acid permease